MAFAVADAIGSVTRTAETMAKRRIPSSGRILALLTFVVVVAALAANPIGLGESTPAPEPGAPTGMPLTDVNDQSEHLLWPYTSRGKSAPTATLPINVIVDRNAAFVRYLLTQTGEARWEVVENRTGGVRNATDRNTSSGVESGVIINGTAVRWTNAEGSTRYTYVYDARADRGRWMDETYQLHHGTYFGARSHIRMYEGGTGGTRWTAIQVHREHWDWFRLRHTVGSVDRAQDRLESEFRTSTVDLEITRTWYNNGGALDADGWITSIGVPAGGLRPMVLSGVGLVAVVAVSGWSVRGTGARLRNKLRNVVDAPAADPRYVLLLSSLALLVIGVRLGAIAVERTAPGLSPKVIAAVFYPILVVGAPACGVLLSRGLAPGESALSAAFGFGAGNVADFLYIDMAVVPLEVVLHRTVLITTIAVLAAGGAVDGDGRWNELLTVGSIVWVVALLIPLFDLL